MKKINKITIIGIIYILISIIHVYASTTEIITKASSTDLKIGDIVTITVSVKSEVGIEAIDSILQYDKSRLKLINSGENITDKLIDLSGEEEETGNYRMTFLNNTTQEVLTELDVAVLKFEVLNGSSRIETINLSKIALVDSNDNLINIEDKEIKLNIIDGGNVFSNNKFIILLLISLSVIVIIVVIKKISDNTNKSKNKIRK